MNTRQLQYALKLSKELNFSQVAEQLNISQPALSKQILNLEKELGVKLFDRDVTPLKLTPAGEHFMRETEELLYKEEQLVRSMGQFRSGEKGRLTIGISPFRSLYMIPPIVRKVQERYPGVQVSLRETGSDTIRREVAEGRYDLAIVNLPVDESLLEVVPLEKDTLVLAVPEKMISVLPDGIGEEGSEIDFADCRELPFIVVGQTQEMRQLFESMCARAEFHPHIVMEVVGLTTASVMVNAGIGASLLPLHLATQETFGKHVKLFRLKNNPFSRQPVIVTRRGQYLSEYAQYAIDLLKQTYPCFEE